MTWGKTTKLCTGAAVLLAGALTLSAGPAAVAGTQPGSVSCTQVTGVVRFDPPLTTGGSASEVASLALLVKGCLASGGGSSPRVGHGSGDLSMATNGCTNLSSASKAAVTIAVAWRPTKVGSSEVTFAGYSPTTAASLGLKMGGRRTSASGSYVGTDAGAASTATVTFNLTPTEVEAACASANGLKMLKIAAGVLALA